MSVDNIITGISEGLGNRLLKLERKSDRRLFIDIGPEAVRDACVLMLEKLDARFQIAT